MIKDTVYDWDLDLWTLVQDTVVYHLTMTMIDLDNNKHVQRIRKFTDLLWFMDNHMHCQRSRDYIIFLHNVKK